MLIKKIQVPKLMLEMIMVAEQILMPFSKKKSGDHAVQAVVS
jgi:hypothetical protein